MLNKRVIMNVAYVGYSEKMLEILLMQPRLKMSKIAYVPSRVNDRYLDIIKENNLEYLEVNTKDDIPKMKSFLEDVEIVIMYKFEFIIPHYLLERSRFFNFHGGDLRTNRGAHAVVRSIINMDTETKLSLYELTGGIDLGILVGEYVVNISSCDTTGSLNKKLQKGIPFLLEQLIMYIDGRKKGIVIDEGKYYPKICAEDITINLEEHSLQKIDAILRSQLEYSGAILPLDGMDKRIKKWTIKKNNRYEERKVELMEHCVKLSEGYLNLVMLFE